MNKDREDTAIFKYTGPEDYKELKVKSYLLQLDDEQKKFLKELYLEVWGIYQKNLPTMVYHICTLSDLSYSWYEVGMEFITPAFVSTSTKKDLKHEGNCKWEITLKPGMRERVAFVKEWSQYKSEEEVLICCCTRFKVISKQRVNEGKILYHICLDYLDK